MNAKSQAAPRDLERRIRRFQSRSYNTVSVSITRRCPLSCRHCIRDAGPKLTHMPGTLASRVAEGVHAQATFRQMSITGGEPFLCLQAVRRLSEAAASVGMDVTVVSSAYWAKTVTCATEKIRTLPAVDGFVFSTDVFHAEFVPPKFIRNAYLAATALGKRASVFMTLGERRSPEEDALVRFVRSFAGDTERFQELAPFGRAASIQIARAPEGKVSVVPCISTGPFVREDGVVFPCCGPLASVDTSHPLVAGHLERQSLGDIIHGISTNPIFQFIRIWGFPRLIAKLRLIGLTSFLPRPSSMRVTPCDTCISILSTPELVDGLRTLASDAAFRLEVAVGALHVLRNPQMLNSIFSQESANQANDTRH